MSEIIIEGTDIIQLACNEHNWVILSGSALFGFIVGAVAMFAFLTFITMR